MTRANFRSEADLPEDLRYYAGAVTGVRSPKKRSNFALGLLVGVLAVLAFAAFVSRLAA